MGWIALSDQNRQIFDLSGLEPNAAPHVSERLTPNSLLARGTLLFETKLPGDGRPRQLLSFHRAHPWVSGLTIQEMPTGGIVLVITQGTEVFHTVLEHGAQAHGEELRVSYSWDAPRRWARLAVERISSGNIYMRELQTAKPLLLSDLRLLTLDPAQRQMDRGVTFLAISTDVEPIGPMPGLTGRVPVLTNFGYRPAAHIKRGDVLRVPGQGAVPVHDVISCTVPARGSLQPIRLRAPYFGLQRDIIVCAQQRLRIGGSAVEYLFGCQEVLVPAGHLVNGVSALRYTQAETVTYYQFVTPRNEPFQTAGPTLESLYLGRLRRSKNVLKSSLLADSNRAYLPEHSTSLLPVLDHFEATTLAELRAA